MYTLKSAVDRMDEHARCQNVTNQCHWLYLACVFYDEHWFWIEDKMGEVLFSTFLRVKLFACTVSWQTMGKRDNFIKFVLYNKNDNKFLRGLQTSVTHKQAMLNSAKLTPLSTLGDNWQIIDTCRQEKLHSKYWTCDSNSTWH